MQPKGAPTVVDIGCRTAFGFELAADKFREYQFNRIARGCCGGVRRPRLGLGCAFVFGRVVPGAEPVERDARLLPRLSEAQRRITRLEGQSRLLAAEAVEQREDLAAVGGGRCRPGDAQDEAGQDHVKVIDALSGFSLQPLHGGVGQAGLRHISGSPWVTGG
jgi:hypothetical protein